VLAPREAWRLITGWCIASRDDGRVCRELANILNQQRGGLVCVVHAPVAAADPDPTAERGS
jgi:hypothetical protein